MSKKDPKSLDELLEEDTEERAQLPGHKNIDWPRLSSTDFAQERAGVFREMRRVGRQRRIAAEVRKADAEAESAKRTSRSVKMVDVRTEES